MGNSLGKLTRSLFSASYKRTISIIAVFLIVLAIPLTVIVAQKQQDIRQHAAGGGTCTGLDGDCCPDAANGNSQQFFYQDSCVSDPSTYESNGGHYTITCTSCGSGTTPTPTPQPNCDSGPSCSGHTENGNNCLDTTCQYMTYSGGGSCTAASAPDQPSSCRSTPTPTPQCASDADCPNGTCTNGVCVACTAGQTKPFFTCTGNTCTASATCGTGAGDCTAAGQQCGVTATPSPTPTPTPTASSTPVPTATATPTPTPNNDVQLALTLALQGIGLTGSSTQPNLTPLRTPVHTSRSVKLSFLNQNNSIAGQATGSAQFNTTTGLFTATVDAGSLAPGQYIVKITANTYLTKRVPGIQNLVSGTNTIKQVTLIAGDVNSDNVLSVQDYSILGDCYDDTKPISDKTSNYYSPNCQKDLKSNPNINPDLNDDGKVDGLDYQLFYDNLSIQTGD